MLPLAFLMYNFGFFFTDVNPITKLNYMHEVICLELCRSHSHDLSIILQVIMVRLLYYIYFLLFSALVLQKDYSIIPNLCISGMSRWFDTVIIIGFFVQIVSNALAYLKTHLGSSDPH